MLRWCQISSKKSGLELIPSSSWKGIAERILKARAGTPLSSVTCEWDDGYEITVHVTNGAPYECSMRAVGGL
ncbi:hypothetical protein M408DRAFT_332386 [Serendipita vermifera MAFF 305830]|uniref:Uncharacterized protein n=1 Tax=Serendipita vermifera MAFF 305830 TaxID=933852 RepID=A0A0C3ATN6_SERVB|nr:hypothetical protein M408DRAFT_332386 [Serendipita vermifera MAFF 305830]